MMKQQKGLPATPSQASPLAKQSEAARGSDLRGGRGQTLLEILLAFSIAMLVLSAIIIGINTSLTNTQYTKNQGLANAYAQEGMDIVRRIKDSDWDIFFAKTAPMYCIDKGSTALRDPSPALNCGQNVDNIFSREVKFIHSYSSCLADPGCSGEACLKGSEVTVKVSWSDSKCESPYCHGTELISCFTQINKKQEP